MFKAGKNPIRDLQKMRQNTAALYKRRLICFSRVNYFKVHLQLNTKEDLLFLPERGSLINHSKATATVCIRANEWKCHFQDGNSWRKHRRNPAVIFHDGFNFTGRLKQFVDVVCQLVTENMWQPCWFFWVFGSGRNTVSAYYTVIDCNIGDASNIAYLFKMSYFQGSFLVSRIVQTPFWWETLDDYSVLQVSQFRQYKPKNKYLFNESLLQRLIYCS